MVTAAALDAAGIGSVSVPVPVPGSHGMVSPHRPSLARDCARHVGDPVALVVARSEAEARDAAEMVEIHYVVRDAVSDVTRTAAPEAPQIWPEAPGNIAVDWHPYAGKPEDRAELDRIFAGAAHIATVRLVNQRIANSRSQRDQRSNFLEPTFDRSCPTGHGGARPLLSHAKVGVDLAELRRFEHFWEPKYLSLLEPTPEGRHYSGVGGTGATVILGGGWAGSSSLSFCSNRRSSASGSV